MVKGQLTKKILSDVILQDSPWVKVALCVRCLPVNQDISTTHYAGFVLHAQMIGFATV